MHTNEACKIFGLSIYRPLYSYTKRLYDVFTILVAVPAIYHQKVSRYVHIPFDQILRVVNPYTRLRVLLKWSSIPTEL